MITEKALGICPACNQPVFYDDEYSAICPCNLDEKNPYHQVSNQELQVKQAQIKNGNYSNCPNDHHGMWCHLDYLLIHEACADKEY